MATVKDKQKSGQMRRGPLGHRVLIFVFSIGVSLLAFWLLGYVIRDIDRIEGPSFQAVVTDQLSPDLSDQQKSLREEIAENKRRSSDLTNQRDLLRKTVENSQQTINQLLDLQKLSLEKEAVLSDGEKTALEENLQSFLDRQRSSQQLSSEIESLGSSTQDLSGQLRDVEERLETEREPLIKAYQDQFEQHQWKLAALKLSLLLPFLVIAGLLFWKFVGGSYTAVLYAFSAALAGRVLLVMHEHFPAIVFRYLLIITALVVATWILIKLLHAVRYPSRNWLQKQYREAYASFVCPVCEFPIRRGPMRFAAWTQKTLRKSISLTSAADAQAGDVPYTCPCCATTLFEKCEQCEATRASLLSACDKCGHRKGSQKSGN